MASTAAEPAPAAAAEEVHQITQAQAGAGVAAHGEAPEIAGALAVGVAAVLDLVQGPQVFLIVRSMLTALRMCSSAVT